MPANALCYTPNGGYKSETSYAGKSSIGEIYMDDNLQASISALEQLSPSSQELVINLIRQLAERENITIPLTLSTGLQTPIDGLHQYKIYNYMGRTICRFSG